MNLITIVRKPGKARECLDPTKLNQAILRGRYPTHTIEEVVANMSEARFFSVMDDTAAIGKLNWMRVSQNCVHSILLGVGTDI